MTCLCALRFVCTIPFNLIHTKPYANFAFTHAAMNNFYYVELLNCASYRIHDADRSSLQSRNTGAISLEDATQENYSYYFS